MLYLITYRMKSFTCRFSFILITMTLFWSGCVNSITVEELQDHVEYLAGDGLSGRMFGTKGIAVAEDYIYRQLDRVSLATEPVFQEFRLYYPVPTGTLPGSDPAAGNLGYVERLGRVFPILFDVAHYPLPFSAAASAGKGQIVFAGYGISAPEYQYDDYEGLDVAGKIVLLLRYEPNMEDPDSVFKGTRHTTYAAFKTKIETAYRNGASGVLLINDPLYHPKDSQAGPPYGFSPKPDSDALTGPIPALHVSIEFIKAVFPDVSFSGLQKALDAGQTPSALPALPAASAVFGVTPSTGWPGIPGRNVVLYVPSRRNRSNDPGREEHIVVIGAHHDHLGGYRTSTVVSDEDEGDRIFNGADDNASGVAVVLELAGRFARGLEHTGLVFVSFSGEELGLFGSKAFMEENREYVSRTGGMLNFDMVGRNPDSPVLLQYSGYGAFADAVTAIRKDGFSEKRYSGHGNALSDFLPFSEEGIPTAFFFTGLHDDYHTFDDEADRLDYDRMKSIADAGAQLLLSLDGIYAERARNSK